MSTSVFGQQKQISTTVYGSPYYGRPPYGLVAANDPVLVTVIWFGSSGEIVTGTTTTTNTLLGSGVRVYGTVVGAGFSPVTSTIIYLDFNYELHHGVYNGYISVANRITDPSNWSMYQ
ncbi:MAG: hypothetical protein LBP67_05325 [Bacteroidales bacterium]|nr:hypothetical protein [Bacteroidales bacterium]